MKNELYEMLGEEQKKEVAELVRDKFIESINAIEPEELHDIVISQFINVMQWAFSDAELDTDIIGDIFTKVIERNLGKLLESDDK